MNWHSALAENIKKQTEYTNSRPSMESMIWCKRYVYAIWMWIDWYRKCQPAEPEYEVWWRVSEANESQASYFVEQADIF